MVAKVLTKMGLMVRSQALIYKSLVQTMLLYGVNSWVVTEAMLKVVLGLRHRVARRIVGISYW